VHNNMGLFTILQNTYELFLTSRPASANTRQSRSTREATWPLAKPPVSQSRSKIFAALELSLPYKSWEIPLTGPILLAGNTQKENSTDQPTVINGIPTESYDSSIQVTRINTAATEPEVESTRNPQAKILELASLTTPDKIIVIDVSTCPDSPDSDRSDRSDRSMDIDGESSSSNSSVEENDFISEAQLRFPGNGRYASFSHMICN
jgi:hypothetical protein